MTQDDRTYTEPELRARLKDEIQAGDRGGKKGQWSARKAQLLVQEYEKAGGGYVDDGHRAPTQEHLKDWGEQDWHTASGSADARGAKGTARYLPDVAWELLSKGKGRPPTPARRAATSSTSPTPTPPRRPAGPPSCSR